MNVARKPGAAGPLTETKVSLPETLLQRAAELGVDVSSAAAAGVERAVSEARARQYAEQHREAVQAWDNYVREKGRPFEDIRVSSV